MKNVLITGGAGFVGSAVTEHLLSRYPELTITIVDNLESGERGKKAVEEMQQRFQDRYQFIKADITDTASLQAIFEPEKFDTVIHYAVTDGLQSLISPEKARGVNTLGSMNVFEVAKESGVQTFLYQSTCEVYGEYRKGMPPFVPSSPLAPKSPYNTTKAEADLWIQDNWEDAGMRVMITRPSNLYGPRQIPYSVGPSFMRSILLDDPIVITGDGSQVREFTHINDYTNALALLLERGQHKEIYNIGTGERSSVADLAKTIVEISGESPTITFGQKRPHDDNDYQLDSSLIRSLGWRPTVGLREGLQQTFEWYKARPRNELTRERQLSQDIKELAFRTEGGTWGFSQARRK